MNYIVGLGNPMRADDGIGPAVIEGLMQKALSPHLVCESLGGNIWNLLPFMQPDTQHILIVDCAKMGMQAGQYRFFPLSELMQGAVLSGHYHASQLMLLVNLFEQSREQLPAIHFMGIEPDDLSYRSKLSSRLLSGLDDYVDAAYRFFDSNGFS